MFSVRIFLQKFQLINYICTQDTNMHSYVHTHILNDEAIVEVVDITEQRSVVIVP